MNNIKTQNTVVVDSSTIHLGKFEKNPSGKYLVIVKDYSDVRNVKTIDRFRCDAHQLCAGVAHWSKES